MDPRTTGPPASCLNCDAPLAGPYCAHCGQRATPRVPTLLELVRDAIGDLLEVDSRVWRTLVPLLSRPGVVTREYLAGRRARYLPPFRLYLVMSVIFFVVAFADPSATFPLLFERPTLEPADVSTAVEPTPPVASNAPLVSGAPEPDAAPAASTGTRTLSIGGAGATAEVRLPALEPSAASGSPDGDDPVTIRVGEDSGLCSLDPDEREIPEILRGRLTPERLQAICTRLERAGGAGVLAGVVDNVPSVLLFLLPLLAVLMKMLYPLTGRRYVEHLLFLLHFHAFVFLLLTIDVAWSRLVDVTGMYGALSVIPTVVAWIYVPIYLYKAMRHVYAQGRLATLAKLTVLGSAYTVSAVTTFAVSLVLAILTV